MPDYLVVQEEVQPLQSETLKGALRMVKRFAETDLVRMTRDAYGILARNLSLEEATLVQRALAEKGVPSQCLPASQWPKLPDARYVKRLELGPDALAVYDPLGRAVPVPWAQLAVVSAGAVRHFATTETVSQEMVRRFNPMTGMSYRLETDVRHQVEDNTRFGLEIVLGSAAMRFEIEAEHFLFKYVFDRPDLELPGKLGLLVSRLAERAPQLRLSRGALALSQGQSPPLLYSSRQALSEESQWWLWHIATTRSRRT